MSNLAELARKFPPINDPPRQCPIALVFLKNGDFMIVDSDDFEYVNGFEWHRSAQGYAISLLGKSGRGVRKTPLHRVLLEIKKGFIGDHRNLDKLDNRRKNLRVASKRQNTYNKPSLVRGRKFKGIHCRHQKAGVKWIAQIRKDGKSKHLGIFPTEELAAEAYNKAASIQYGEFAFLNKVSK